MTEPSGSPAAAPSRRRLGSPATLVMALAMGLIYALQVAWGGPGSEPLLARMGALHGLSVLDGQLWRLASGAYLHVDPAHLATNLVVLVAVGRPVERLLGTARWLILFAAAVIGGAVASLAFTPGLAAGASGGLLGLLAACVVLAVTRADALEPGPRLMVRTGAALALGVTVMQSFQPGIDMAAHIGGAVAGALVMLAPAMRPDSLGQPATEELRIGGVFAALVLILAPTLALFAGGGWAVMDPPTLAPRPFGGLSVPAPDLPPRGSARPSGEAISQLFGGVEDTAIVGLATAPADPDTIGRTLAALATRWAEAAPEPGFTPRDPPRFADDPPRVTAVFDGPDGRILEIAMVAIGDRQLRVDVAPRPPHGAQWRGVAERMALGAAPAPTGSP